MGYATENDLKWKQAQKALINATSFAIKEDVFTTLSSLQEAEIMLRSIMECEEKELKRREQNG